MDFEIVGFEGDGSKLLKQERSGLSFDDLRQPKCAKSDDFSTLLLRNNDGEMQEGNMLSFSVKNNGGFDGKSVQIAALPYLQQAAASYSKNAGYLSTGLNASMYLWDGPFTHSQWLELEHQALIYKYIIANEPIPPILLLPLRKALQSAGFSAGPFRPTSLGWGPFHLGFSSSTDPEPGRCRRTDGKKWRCSKDAVPDQKYCERHMNRGRHRSRKPVEGRTGHSVSTPTTTTTANNVTSSAMNLVPMTSSTAAVVVPGGGASNGFNFTLHQAKNLQCDSPNHSGLPLTNRTCLSNLNNTRGVQNAAGVDFLLSDSLLNSTRTYTPFQDLNAHEPEPHPLRHFIDDWPKNPVNQSNLLWPEPENHSERTHLSISIPTPTSEKSTLSPLRLARDIDPIQMGLGVGPSQNELSHRPVNWVPISWETSMGGPLGEALRTSNSGSRGSEGSPQMGLSPTGVLQKSAFGSVSSSSAEI